MLDENERILQLIEQLEKKERTHHQEQASWMRWLVYCLAFQLTWIGLFLWHRPAIEILSVLALGFFFWVAFFKIGSQS